MYLHNELNLFPGISEKENTTTFLDNMSLPIHRWYRYTAGFSAEWVRDLVRKEKENGRSNIIDPFVGSGTVSLACQFEGVNSIGVESHPYIYKISQAKLSWDYPYNDFKSAALSLLIRAKTKKIQKRIYPPLLIKCYPEEVLYKLESLKESWHDMEGDEKIKNLCWFIITSILRSTSPVGTAQWQYIQPNKTKSKVLDPYSAFEDKVNGMFLDMRLMQSRTLKPVYTEIFNEDSREIKSIEDGWGDLVITSPPYANNYDYADATRLEMTFWGDISGWTDLQSKVRRDLVRACTQHVSKLGDEIDEMLADNLLHPIYSMLKEERLKHGGKKNYHYMIVAYFSDLARVFVSLRKKTKRECLMCFVIGDSAPYGVYVPVEKWLGDLAVSAGFNDYSFEKLRDRNIKWKNRKHNVPLHEGRLWIKG